MNRPLMLLALLVGASCTSPTDSSYPVPTPGSGQVHLVTLTPSPTTLAVGETLRLTARATTTSGTVVVGAVEWLTDNDSIAGIQPDGTAAVVEARRPGTTKVRARIGGKLGEATVTVRAPDAAVAQIELTTPTAILQPGAQSTIAAQPRDEHGAPLAGRVVTWLSTDTTVLAVTPGGTATPAGGMIASIVARASGTARVVARLEGIEAEAVFTVEAAPAPVGWVIVSPPRRGVWIDQYTTFDVMVAAPTGGPLPGAAVNVWVEDPSVAEIDQPGRIRGLRPGVSRIVAESGGVRGYATIRVYEFTQQMEFLLTYDWWDGQARPATVLGTTLWTDDEGVEREVDLNAVSGVFRMDLDSETWSLTLQSEAHVRVGEEVRIIHRAVHQREGAVVLRWTPANVLSFDFIETAEPRPVYTGFMRSAGELLIGLPALGGQQDFLFRLPG